MVGSLVKRVVVTGMVASATLVGGHVRPAAAVPLEFPAGLVCEVPVVLDASADTRKEHLFTNAEGDVIRKLQTGLGSAGTLTNADTRATFSFPAKGAVWSTVFNPDGTQTVTAVGNLILFLFPTDIPAGPSTTLYAGRVVFHVDPATGVFTLISVKGRSTDLCAVLST